MTARLYAARGSADEADVPLIIITVAELALMVLADRRSTAGAVTWGSKWIWAVIIVLFGMIGPIVYFVPVGRRQRVPREAARRSAGAQFAGAPAPPPAASRRAPPTCSTAAGVRRRRPARTGAAAARREDSAP